jgi:hypothetical protein
MVLHITEQKYYRLRTHTLRILSGQTPRLWLNDEKQLFSLAEAAKSGAWNGYSASTPLLRELIFIKTLVPVYLEYHKAFLVLDRDS